MMNGLKRALSSHPFGMFKKAPREIPKPSMADCLADVMAASKQAKRKILLVDDDEHFQELVQHFQRGVNADVMPAGSVGIAKALIQERPFDLLIVDWNIPNGHPGGKGNGALLCEWIKNKYPQASVIVLTNSDPNEIAPELERKTGRSIPVYGKGSAEQLSTLFSQLLAYASKPKATV